MHVCVSIASKAFKIHSQHPPHPPHPLHPLTQLPTPLSAKICSREGSKLPLGDIASEYVTLKPYVNLFGDVIVN